LSFKLQRTSPISSTTCDAPQQTVSTPPSPPSKAQTAKRTNCACASNKWSTTCVPPLTLAPSTVPSNHRRQYINQAFTLAAPNLSINGLPVDPAHFIGSSSSPASATAPLVQYEPFDARKRYKMEDLAREEEDLLRSIAALKRRIPAATAAAYASASRNGMAADEAALEAARARVETEGAISGRKAVEGVWALDRQEELEEEFAATVDTLGRLKREMPATLAKMERARVAAGYVATEL
jgi:kinetochor protein Mis14/NSL1